MVLNVRQSSLEMKITKRTKTLILLYLNIVATLVVAASFTYTTMAWFITNRAQSIHASSVEVDAPGFTVNNFECYGVTAINSDSSTTSFTFANEELFVMPTYDPQGIDYSRFLKAIVVHVSFTYTEVAPVTFYAKTLTNTFTTGNSAVGIYDENYTSNSFQFTISPGTTLTSGWETASVTYTNANTKSFVTIASTPSKTTSLTLGSIAAGASDFWFVIEYNEAVMDYIYNDRLTNNKPVLYLDDINYQVSP